MSSSGLPQAPRAIWQLPAQQEAADQQTQPQPQQPHQQQQARTPPPQQQSQTSPPHPRQSSLAAASVTSDAVQQLLAALAAEKSRNVDLVRQSLTLQGANSALLTELDASASYATRLKGDLASVESRAARYRERASSYRSRAHSAEASLSAVMDEAEARRLQVLSMFDELRGQFVEVLSNWSAHIGSLAASEQDKVAQLETMRAKLAEHAEQIAKAKDQLAIINQPSVAAHRSRYSQAVEDTEQLLRAAHAKFDRPIQQVPVETKEQARSSPPRPHSTEQTSPREQRGRISPYSALNHPSASASRVDTSVSLSAISAISGGGSGGGRHSPLGHQDSTILGTSSTSSPRAHVSDLVAQAEREAGSTNASSRYSPRERGVDEAPQAGAASISPRAAAAQQPTCACPCVHVPASAPVPKAVTICTCTCAHGSRGASARSQQQEQQEQFLFSAVRPRGLSRERPPQRSRSNTRSPEPRGPCYQRPTSATSFNDFSSGGRARSQDRGLARPARSRSTSRGALTQRGRSRSQHRSRTRSPLSSVSYPEFLSRAHSSYLHTHSSSQKMTAASKGQARLPSSFPERPCSGARTSCGGPRDFLHHSPSRHGQPRSGREWTRGGAAHSSVQTTAPCKPVYSYSSTGDLLSSPLSCSLKRPVGDGWRLSAHPPHVETGRELKQTDPPTPPQTHQVSAAKTKSLPAAGVRTKRDPQ